MDGGDESRRSIYRRLLDRFQNLESSHHKLKEQFQVLLQEKNKNVGEDEMTSDSERTASFPGWGCLSGAHCFESPYRSVLEYMGHAVHVSRAGSGEIIYWNNAAEKLYGYKNYEVVGQRAIELLFDEEHHRSALLIMARLNTGESWSGQLPLRKRSGQNFMAMVSKSPLYEEGELVGIITVSSDASAYNTTNSENTRTRQDHADDVQLKFPRINLKKIQWHPQPQAVPVPSSISNLASKILSWKRGDDMCDVSTRESDEAVVESEDAKAERPPRVPIAKTTFGLSIGRNRAEDISSEKEESTSEFFQPPKIAVKLFSKLQRGAFSNSGKAMDENTQQNVSEDSQMKTATENETNQTEDKAKSVDSEDASPRQTESPKIPSSGESFGSGHQSSSSKGDDSHVVVDSEIRWEDLHLKEEIGHGSFAVVYRGVWNGSDVAVKVYTGSQYTEETLLDYKKEIDIMRRLRHPNVLLFMGAVCDEEKLAMVTEYLTRGSLYKTLHRNNQSLDIRRRLRMAIDVARGMNYLHHRNPPIVHRDLKSSNLLVDKSWTVKVGDFGLSKLKYATFLTAKSGRGTPQWMAPEVLRNELSTEKSDVFSFGVILWELMTKRIPWSELNSLQVVGVVGFMDSRLDIPSNMNPQVSSVISDCWRSNPDDRPSFEDIIRKMTDVLVHTNARGTAKTASTRPSYMRSDSLDD